MKMCLGIDFDNTLVCYDELFHRVAVERGLIPIDLPVSKGHVRDYLRHCDQEEEWIHLQGYVYGAGTQGAAFPGALACLARFVKQGIRVYVISHKTHVPGRGPRYDLHKAAQQWLKQQGVFDPTQIGLSRKQVFFELTKQEKLDRITQTGCTHFIDDLPEFLAEPGFPTGVERILFDPKGFYPTEDRFHRVTSWLEIEELIMTRRKS